MIGMIPRRQALAGLLLLLGTATWSFGAEAVTPGDLVVEPPTLICLGFEWPISGDDDRDAAVSVRYRVVGDPDWREALPLLRIGGEEAGTPALGYVTPRMFAGSILDLEPGTEYEVRLEMTDPDGVEGEPVRTASVTTRTEPRPAPGGRVRHVYPEGWTGTREEPAFQGLLHAYYGYERFADWNLTVDPVQPGDVVEIHAGIYRADRFDYRDFHGVTFHGTYELTQKGTAARPIVIRAAGDGPAVFDGNGAWNLFNMLAADHHIVEGLTLRNTDVAILAGLRDVTGATGLTVRRCHFEEVGIGIRAQYQGSRGFVITDNVFVGREPADRIITSRQRGERSSVQRMDSYYAVKVYGQGHVIAYNRAERFFDGFDVDTHGSPETRQDWKSVAIDIYNNDVRVMNDNFIEADGGTHNIRVLRNRCINSGQAGLTSQPVMGGPAYFVRNVVINTPHKPAVKYWGMRAAGVLVYHNTFLTFMARPHKGASNVHYRNNLFLPPDESSEPVVALMTYTAYSSSDYNGFRVRGTTVEPFAWNGPAPGVLRDYSLEDDGFATFDTFDAYRRASGLESSSVVVDYDIFERCPHPHIVPLERAGERAFALYDVAAFDLRLRSSAPAVDAGARLPNVNDDATGTAPDLGAHELGLPVPHYGPRPEGPWPGRR